LALPESDALLHFVRGFAALAQDGFAEALRQFRSGLACQPSNPALCSDVEQLIQAVEALERRDVPHGEEPASSHVLLSAYSGRVH
jgi:hypothetical protein